MRTRYRLGFTGVCALLPLLAAAPAGANSQITLYVQVGQNYPVGVVPAPQYLSLSDTSPGPTTSTASLSLATDGPSAAARAGAYAFASAGRLAVSAVSSGQVKTGHYDSQGHASMPVEAGTATAEATARWADLVTISDPALAGQRGTATAWIQLSGSVSALASAYANLRSPDGGFLVLDSNGSARVQVGGNGLVWTSQSWDDDCAARGWAGWLACARAVGYDPSGQGNYHAGSVTPLPVQLDFIFGTPFALGYSLVAASSGYAMTGYYKMAGAGEGTGVADMSHTLLWGGISGVFSSTGAPVTAYTLSADSGFDYRVAAAVPDAPTWALWLAGLLVLARQAGQRRIA